MRCDTSSIVDPDKLGGPDFPSPGSYHFEIEEVVEEDPQSGCMYAVCRIRWAASSSSPWPSA